MKYSFLFYSFFLDTMIRNGDVELKAREEEIRFLKMEVTMKYFKSLSFVSM